ncbi:hypothetical protein Q0A17_12780 [Citrobacter sp. S2-9]|uniref:Uncharacterized protein n=1 Tax=Citrobacter enshiensis TaxID=2971264 RepID=A0ABT8PWC9_9ENTR|nr:hypothetical protein [Citrobacter enshiensis]MDN8600277.1 hypothetical protein [Citrobacter enshiensis]
MKVISCHSNHSSMPAWVTISEAANIINQQQGISVTESDIWRYVLYGHLLLSVYFQSPVKLCRVTKNNNNVIVLIRSRDNIISRLCYLSPECLINSDNWLAKTEGKYIYPDEYIIDTPLIGHECIALQQRLAHSLGLPPPMTGLCNIHCGILVQDGNEIYQAVDYMSSGQRIIQQLQHLPSDKREYYQEKLSKLNVNQEQHHYFPVYHFPDDAWFVVKRTNLERFLSAFSSPPVKPSNQISTPLSRLLWLACKHNDSISSLINHPYKLTSVFEQWAIADGITDRLSGDTLKKALQRGAPSLL